MRLLLISAALLISTRAYAQKFEYGKYDDVKDVKAVEWKATAEGGLVFTTGSSETLTATGGIKLQRRSGDNQLQFEASAAYAKSNIRTIRDFNNNMLIDDELEITSVDTVTAETIASKLRYDRYLTNLNSLYIAALAARDTPAGKESVFGGQAGYSRTLEKTEKAQTVAEVGYDFSREDLITGDPLEIHSLRGFIGHKATMAEGAELDASAEVLTNLNELNLVTTRDGVPVDGGPLKDTRVILKAAVSAKIGVSLSFQMSVEARYDNRPGPLPIKMLAPGFVPEAAAFDTIMKASFIYTFVDSKLAAAPK